MSDVADSDGQVVTAFVGMGSNVGDSVETLAAAVWVLDDLDGTRVVDVSAFYETAPWGGVEQDPFVNAVARLETSLSPAALLAELHAVEAAMGRDRDNEVRWGPRTIDLDLLLHGDAVVDGPDLVVPHPRLVERAFVLIPLMEVFPGGSLPDGTRLTRAVQALAPITGIELLMRLPELPGGLAIERPEGPRGGAISLGARPSERPDLRGDAPSRASAADGDGA